MKEEGKSKETKILEPAFEPEQTFIEGLGWSDIGHSTISGMVDVKNGKIIRIRPTHYDWKYPELKPWTFEARGKVWQSSMKSTIAPFSIAYKKRTYSPNRIKFPLKRIDWDPNGERNPQNRGKSKFKKISWDEATDIIASELKRVVNTYGGQAILADSAAHGQTRNVHAAHSIHKVLLDRWLSKMGKGSYSAMQSSPVSWEGSAWGSKHMWGFEPFGEEPTEHHFKDVSDNTEMIMHWGCDLETNPWMTNGLTPSQILYWFTELGIKHIFISPDLNYSAAVHADKWIPVLPNTDAALGLAIAYVWITKGIYDKDYIATHAYGFDKFKAYVIGEEDGVPKTPAWASPICGVTEWTIKALAREWASHVTSTAHSMDGGGLGRGPYSTENKRLEVALLAMQGLGKPGVHQMQLMANPMPFPKVPPSTLGAYQGEVPITELVFRGIIPEKVERQFLPEAFMNEGIVNPPVSWWGGGVVSKRMEQFEKHEYPLKGSPEAHMYWSDSGCHLVGCSTNTNSKLDAIRSPKIEFVLIQHPWMENGCLFADIVLPSNTIFESQDIVFEQEQFSSLIVEPKLIEGIGESKSDYEAVGEIAKKLDMYDEFSLGRTVEDWMKNGYKNSGWQDLITWEELNRKGYVVQGPDPDWKIHKPATSAFYENPKKNPLPSPTGLIEFQSTGLKEHFPDDKERPPVPHWVPGGPASEGWTHDERLSGKRCKEFPLLMVSNAPKWRIHSQMDDIPWTREINKVKGFDGYMYEHIWINPADAAPRGIENGDIIKIYNERGSVLGGACLSERIIAGAVGMDHGARFDPITDGLDRGGSTNAISPHNGLSQHCPGYAVTGYLVEVEKVSQEQMAKWRKQYPEAFDRDYDPASGLRFDAWVEGGMD
jgi:molybdopterin guanine dinucleotide-containing S/N-oxide reductase-like protein